MSFVVSSADPAGVRSLHAGDSLAFPAVAISAQVLPSKYQRHSRVPTKTHNFRRRNNGCATMRERVTGWDVFLESFSGVRQCSRLGSVAVRACLTVKQLSTNKQAGSNVDMTTADKKFRLKEDGQQKNDKLSVQLGIKHETNSSDRITLFTS